MAIYKEILDWSNSKSPWIRDSLRRLITQPQLSSKDVDEILLLLKKENGFLFLKINPQPLTEKDLPSTAANVESPIQLLKIENPKNINALHADSTLSLNAQGLTIIYGGNGSGKSGYARILKKTCWSRDKNVILKKNVYQPTNSDQEFTVSFYDAKSIQTFKWKDSAQIPDELNSIFVFDSRCAFIYLNQENPTEYKPIGLDVLERLCTLCNDLSEKIENEENSLNASKPGLDNKYSTTKIYGWYNNLQSKEREEVKQKLEFSAENKKRLVELNQLLSKTNPAQENATLLQKISRYTRLKDNLKEIEDASSTSKISEYEKIRKDFLSKKAAHKIASEKFKVDDPLPGVGSDTWKLLWEAAKEYAITEIHPDLDHFPAGLSKEYCVLCQQKLENVSIKRLERFQSFISDTTSVEMAKSKQILEDLRDTISALKLDADLVILELDSEVSNFKKDAEEFKANLTSIKSAIIQGLKGENPIQVSVNIKTLSKTVNDRIVEIEKTIKSNEKLITDKQSLITEQLELSVTELLVKERDQIINFYEEGITKYWLNQAKLKTNTRFISLKIGEVLETNAIQEQHKEFIKQLSKFNPELAKKVILRKTRTAQGLTFQKCAFNGLSDPLNEILSEGEQKILAISNFIAECTIDGCKNSIVFDDPVSSLDQDYKEEISRSISSLAMDRQIIVLTHDLNFVRLLIDDYKKITSNDCTLIGLKSYGGFTGIVTDEIPYLAKNIQERIDSIRKDLKEINAFAPTKIDEIEDKTELASKRMRLLLEKTVEDILANKTIQRFSKNIAVKAKQLSNFVVTEKSDIDFILKLFGKYSIPEHDSGTSSAYKPPKVSDISNDLKEYEDWKKDFLQRAKTFVDTNKY